MRTRRIVVIGAGIGGLVAALLLASRGFAVTVIESAATPGGKMREVAPNGAKIDAGPTVFTMRWVFDEILEEVGISSLSDRLTLLPLETLARHAWRDGAKLDLFTDSDRSADAIGAFAGSAEAEGYRQFCKRAGAIYDALRETFIRASKPNPLTLVRRAGLRGLPSLVGISPFTPLWGALEEHFRDQRLRQLFGRYATYCGSSPFAAPATLMLVAHVEREGVWLVQGGMHRLAELLSNLAQERGVTFHYGRRAERILVENGRTCGLATEDGELFAADAIVMNGDAAALGAGALGEAAKQSEARMRKAARSLSAVTWAINARTSGFPLAHHNVFFSDEYRAEFEDIFSHNRLPRAPSVYVCAQDRDDDETPGARVDAERLLCLVNAPPTGDENAISASEFLSCEDTVFRFLATCGLEIERDTRTTIRTTPQDFARLFPATGGALYGRASHGWMASFARPGSRTRLPGLYLAGGSTHPGPGVPMAALSGRLAAQSVSEDLVSTRLLSLAATSGGISTRSATTVVTD
jgi:1-hydroxycarotenoid 3,4-desaturase